VRGACSVFDEGELELLEWLEDVRLFETQGPGAEINSRWAGAVGWLAGWPVGGVEHRRQLVGVQPTRQC